MSTAIESTTAMPHRALDHAASNWMLALLAVCVVAVALNLWGIPLARLREIMPALVFLMVLRLYHAVRATALRERGAPTRTGARDASRRRAGAAAEN